MYIFRDENSLFIVYPTFLVSKLHAIFIPISPPKRPFEEALCCVCKPLCIASGVALLGWQGVSTAFQRYFNGISTVFRRFKA